MRRSIQGMLEELEYNLWEHILCRLVDYGHTFSPELEMAALSSGAELLHGEAVNIDMALTTQARPFRLLQPCTGVTRQIWDQSSCLPASLFPVAVAGKAEQQHRWSTPCRQDGH